MNKVAGVFFAVFAAVTYGMNPLFGIPLYEEGIHPYSVLFYRFSIAAVLMGITAALRRKSFRLPRKYWLWSVIAGVLMALTCLFWFLTFEIMDSGIAAAMLFVYPVMVTLIMWIFFREKQKIVTCIGMVLAVCGVALLCAGDSGGEIPVAGVVYIMLSALTYAIYIVMVKTTNLRELAPEILTFYAMIFAVAVFLVPLRMGADIQLLDSWKEWGNAIGLALFPSLCAFLFAAVAINIIGPAKTAILGALEPVTAVAIGMVVFGESVSLTGFAAIGLIIFAVTLVISEKSNPTESQL